MPRGGQVQTEDISYRSPDGLKLYAKAYGPADARLTVLCMHGLTRNHRDFEPMVEAVGGPHRYIAVDVRGRGRSERDPDASNYTPATYAGDMAALLDHLHLDKVALIGTSMGGLMSFIMAKSIPQRIRGIVLNDVGPVVEKAGLARIASYAGTVEPVESWQAAAANVEAVQKNVFPHLTAEDWMAFAKRTYRELGGGHVVLDYDPAITRTVGDVKPGLLMRIAMWRLYKASYKFPQLLIRGETSDILSPKTANKMVKRHPDAELVTVPGVGHAPLLDEPAAVSAISRFLTRLEA